MDVANKFIHLSIHSPLTIEISWQILSWIHIKLILYMYKRDQKSKFKKQKSLYLTFC